MKSIAEIDAEIISELSSFNDQTEKYAHIISIGEKLPPLQQQHRCETYLVKGCQSKVWLFGYVVNDRIYYEADSNTVIVKGIVSLLIRTCSGQRSEDILNAEFLFMKKINPSYQLNQFRMNGLRSLILTMKSYCTK